MEGIRTEGDAVVAEGLPEDAVELPHLAQGGCGPAVGGDACLDLFPEGHEEVWLLREVVNHMGEDLKGIMALLSVEL